MPPPLSQIRTSIPPRCVILHQRRDNLALGVVSESGGADYILGNSDAEHDRLIRQAERLAPVTERFLREAGIGPGQRVLDVGAGVGDVTILLSHLVGRQARS
jgi:hypothetical protein